MRKGAVSQGKCRCGGKLRVWYYGMRQVRPGVKVKDFGIGECTRCGRR